ncbi:MAG: HAD family hydrolase [Deinococcus sp.]|nr:HAD family hydrolase [Deinococcus sp.]
MKLFAFDLDGTLLPVNGGFTPETLAMVRDLQHRGHLVTIITGRTLESARPWALRLGINAPLGLLQGTVVKHLDGQILSQRTMPFAQVRPAVTLAEADHLQVEAFRDSELFINYLVPGAPEPFANQGLAPKLVGSFAHFEAEVSKVVIVANPQWISAKRPQIRAAAPQAHFTTADANYLELLPPGVNKSTALQFLAQYYGIAQHDTIAAGDNWNDTEMIAWAGTGIAMGNAPEVVKCQAKLIVGTVADHSLVEAVLALA